MYVLKVSHVLLIQVQTDRISEHMHIDHLLKDANLKCSLSAVVLLIKRLINILFLAHVLSNFVRCLACSG